MPMREYLPRIDDDEIGYFLQIKAFTAHGFRVGNFFLNDQVPASRIHFGLHGPTFVVLYGIVARAIGWSNDGPFIVNLLFFVPSWLLVQYSLRRHPLRQIIAALFVLMNGYFFLFLPSMMQETFHLSIALLIAALSFVALETGATSAWGGLFAVIIVAAMTRFTWALTVPMFLFAWLRERIAAPSRRCTAVLIVIAAAVGVGATYAAMRLWTFWTAPASGGGAAVLIPSLADVRHNLAEFSSFRVLRVFELIPVYFRIWWWGAMVVFATAFMRAHSSRTRNAALYSLLFLTVPAIAQVAYYIVDGYRDFRVLAGFHALASVTFLSRASDDWLPAAVRSSRRAVAVVAALVVATNLYITFDGARFRYDFEWQRNEAPSRDRDARASMDTMQRSMEFLADDSSFCKTVYGPIETFDDPTLIHLPLGFGFSVVVPTQPNALPPLRGKYMLTHDAATPVRRLVDASAQWGLVGVFGRFRLYRSKSTCLGRATV